MYRNELNAFADSLIKDTSNNIIYWSRIGEYGGEYHSIDFRYVNEPLSKWTNQETFIFNSWNDAYITNIMSGFVLLAKTKNLPPLYYLYIQPDSDGPFYLVNCEEAILKKLYNAVISQLNVSYSNILDFLESYFSVKANSNLDNDKSLSE